MFALTSWVQVMIGPAHRARARYHPLVDSVADAELAQLDESVRGVIASCVAAMPEHEAVHRALLPGAGGRMMRKPMRVRLTAFIAVCASALTLLACKTPAKKTASPWRCASHRSSPCSTLDPLLDDVEKRTFNFFWETAEGATGLVPDRWPAAAVREHRGRRLRAQCLRHRRGARLRHARAGARARADHAALPAATPSRAPIPRTAPGYQGFFYHFLNFGTGKRYGNSELSTVDTALLMAGVLFVGGYFDQDERRRSARSASSPMSSTGA